MPLGGRHVQCFISLPQHGRCVFGDCFPCASSVATLYFFCLVFLFLSFRFRELYTLSLCLSFRLCTCSGCVLRNRCFVNVVANECRALFRFMLAKAMLLLCSAAAGYSCSAAAGTFQTLPLVGRGAMRRKQPSRLSRRASPMLWCVCLFVLLWCVCLFALLWCCVLFSICCGAFVLSLCCDVVYLLVLLWCFLSFLSHVENSIS